MIGFVHFFFFSDVPCQSNSTADFKLRCVLLEHGEYNVTFHALESSGCNLRVLTVGGGGWGGDSNLIAGGGSGYTKVWSVLLLM